MTSGETILLATAQGPLAGAVPWWQVLGGTLAVFALLMICLRLLGRLHRASPHQNVTLLDTWKLGPRREIQVVRLHDMVHFLYRHEGALVVLERQDYAQYQASRPPTGRSLPAGLPEILGRLTGLFHAQRGVDPEVPSSPTPRET